MSTGKAFIRSGHTIFMAQDIINRIQACVDAAESSRDAKAITGALVDLKQFFGLPDEPPSQRNTKDKGHE